MTSRSSEAKNGVLGVGAGCGGVHFGVVEEEEEWQSGEPSSVDWNRWRLRARWWSGLGVVEMMEVVMEEVMEKEMEEVMEEIEEEVVVEMEVRVCRLVHSTFTADSLSFSSPVRLSVNLDTCLFLFASSTHLCVYLSGPSRQSVSLSLLVRLFLCLSVSPSVLLIFLSLCYTPDESSLFFAPPKC